MKKSKYSLLLSVLTLVLCIGVMATGIYAAKTAILNISGNLGFSMHDAIVDVVGTVKNVAEESGDGVTTKNIERVIRGPQGETTDEIINSQDLGNLYFYGDRDMIFTFTFKNISSKSLLASISISGLNSNIMVVEDVVYDKLPADKPLLVDKTNTLIFALRVVDRTQRIDLTSFTISVGLEQYVKKDSEGNVITVYEYTSEEKNKIRSKTVTNTNFTSKHLSYAERFPYYIYMGKSSYSATTEDIKWLIVGYMNNGVLTNLTEEDKQILSNGYMLGEKDYCLLSAELLPVIDNDKYGISFQNNYTTTPTPCKNKYGLEANDYFTSNVRSYLKNKSVYRGSTAISGGYIENDEKPTLFESKYSLSSSKIYNSIKLRAVTDFVNEIPSSQDGYQEIPQDMLTGDRFWLLSYQEAYDLFSADTYNNGNVIFRSAAITTILGTESQAEWYLRSGTTGNGSYIKSVKNVGVMEYYNMAYEQMAVRPVFLI